MLDQNSHRMRLLRVGMSNQKSKFHTSSCFGNRPLASCHPASCQGKSSYQAGRCWQLELARPILQEQKRGARAAVRGLTLHLPNAALLARRMCVCPAWDAAQVAASEQLCDRNLIMVCPALSFASSCISLSLTLILLCLFKCIYFQLSSVWASCFWKKMYFLTPVTSCPKVAFLLENCNLLYLPFN